MTSFEKGIIGLVKSAISGVAVSIPEDFDWAWAYRLAKSHRVIPLIYYGAVNSGINPPAELSNKLFTATVQSIAVAESQKRTVSKLCSDFEAAGLDYMLLKGSIIKQLYARPELRSMGDIDILIHYEQYDKMIPILESLGLKFVKENENELAWDNHPVYIELHRYLVAPKHKDYYRYFGDGWHLAQPISGSSHGFEMTDEDYFVYLFAHFAKHYRSSGIGIKHITDIFVYRNAKPGLDAAYINSELEKLGLRVFYDNILKTVECWFGDREYDEATSLITAKILNSGAFGTHDDVVLAEAVKNKQNAGDTRIKKLIKLLFLPYGDMCILYPVLKKLPFLLPFMWVWRWLKTLIFKRGNAKKSLGDIKTASVDRVSSYEEQLKAVGLDFNFEE